MVTQEYYKKVDDLRRLVNELEHFTEDEIGKRFLEDINEDREARSHAKMVRANAMLKVIGNMVAFYLDI